jgi:NFU1 iron-sulfur cluster scaffold homolog, mitochondrial
MRLTCASSAKKNHHSLREISLLSTDSSYLYTMTDKRPVNIYAESTPNPASMKFVVNFFLLEEGSVEYTSKEQTKNCPLAYQLLSFSGISGVFIMSNFITLTKTSDLDWYEQIPILREYIKSYLETGQPVFTGPAEQVANEAIDRTHTASAVESKIIETLDEYVRPAVEQDGGAIHFKSFDKGIVTLVLKGACSGCPSSAITLKSGIENLLKKLVPEVTEVVAEEG